MATAKKVLEKEPAIKQNVGTTAIKAGDSTELKSTGKTDVAKSKSNGSEASAKIINKLQKELAQLKDEYDLAIDQTNSNALQRAVNTAWASIEFELDGTIITANQQFVDAVGYGSADEFIGKHHRIFVDPTYAKSSEYQHFWKELSKGNNQSGEFVRTKKDGNALWLNASYTPIKNDQGEFFKIIKIANDITTMVEERTNGLAIKAAVDIAWASIEFELDGTIITANQNFTSTLGYSSTKEIRGKHHRIFVDPKYAKSSEYKQFWAELNNGNNQSGDFERIAKDGKAVWINAAYTPVKDDEGNVFKIVKIAQDITTQKANDMAFEKIVVFIKELASGNLTPELSVEGIAYDEGVKAVIDDLLNLRKSFNDLLTNISDITNLIASSSEELLTKADQMKSTTQETSSAIQQMAEGAHQQAAQTDEASKLVEGVLTSSNEMAAKAELINTAAEDGQKSSNEGLSTVKMVVQSMEEIEKSAKVTSDSIDVLNERSEEIARTLNVITDIASQTNLLALNAAIEAARAGDAGRGFAVVAEEIRKLAEDSRSSAVDIQKVITAVQKDVTQASKAIDEMGSGVKNGNQASKEAEVVFESIAKSTSESLTMSQDILQSTNQQKKSINDTVKNIEKIVVVSEETAAGTEQIATSSKELNMGMDEVASTSQQLADVANQLQEGVSKFKLLNE